MTATLNQDVHAQAVDGARVAAGGDWDVAEVDLSPARVDELSAKFPGGGFYLIARYD